MKFIVTMIVAMVLSSGVYAQEQTKEEGCMQVAYTFFQQIAVLRDAGAPPAGVVIDLMVVGIDQEAALEMVTFVYITRADSTPEEVGNEILNLCMGEPT